MANPSIDTDERNVIELADKIDDKPRSPDNLTVTYKHFYML